MKIEKHYRPRSVKPPMIGRPRPCSVGPSMIGRTRPRSVGPPMIGRPRPCSVGPSMIDRPRCNSSWRTTLGCCRLLNWRPLKSCLFLVPYKSHYSRTSCPGSACLHSCPPATPVQATLSAVPSTRISLHRLPHTVSHTLTPSFGHLMC